jgi:hypothetical protein
MNAPHDGVTTTRPSSASTAVALRAVPMLTLYSSAIWRTLRICSPGSHLRCVEMAPLAALQALATASRELLRRSAELPDSEQGLLDVLAQYRYAVYAFLAITGGL